MKLLARWFSRLSVLLGVILLTGLILTLLIHALMAPPERRVVRQAREFRPPQIARGTPEVLKQLAIVTIIAVLGRKVLRIRLG